MTVLRGKLIRYEATVNIVQRVEILLSMPLVMRIMAIDLPTARAYPIPAVIMCGLFWWLLARNIERSLKRQRNSLEPWAMKYRVKEDPWRLARAILILLAAIIIGPFSIYLMLIAYFV